MEKLLNVPSGYIQRQFSGWLVRDEITLDALAKFEQYATTIVLRKNKVSKLTEIPFGKGFLQVCRLVESFLLMTVDDT